MVDVKRSLLEGAYHVLDISDCPVDVVMALAGQAKCDVTVENVRPLRYANEWFVSDQALYPDGPRSAFKLRNASYDAALTNSQFSENTEFWDKNGVYALFTEKSPIPFKASELSGISRYKALGNFGFVLEVALAGPSSDGVSRFVSLKKDLIDLAEGIAAKDASP